MTRRRLRTVAWAAALVVASTATLTACSSTRPQLSRHDSACFKSLPLARATLHQQGRLVGVRAVSRDRLDRLLRDLPARTSTTTTADGLPSTVCLVAFRGQYRAEQLVAPRVNGSPTGSHAVVAVTTRRPRVVAVLVADRLPLRFGGAVRQRA